MHTSLGYKTKISVDGNTKAQLKTVKDRNERISKKYPRVITD